KDVVDIRFSKKLVKLASNDTDFIVTVFQRVRIGQYNSVFLYIGNGKIYCFALSAFGYKRDDVFLLKLSASNGNIFRLSHREIIYERNIYVGYFNFCFYFISEFLDNIIFTSSRQ